MLSILPEVLALWFFMLFKVVVMLGPCLGFVSWADNKGLHGFTLLACWAACFAWLVATGQLLKVNFPSDE